MNNTFKVKDLDKTTLEFAIEKAWQYDFMCKNTKEGRIESKAYNKVIETLKHFLNELE